MSSIPSSFQDFALPAALAKALLELKLESPTLMQIETIPPALQRRDVMGRAQSGTGKTAAFLIPMITRLARSAGKRGLILVPTRARGLRASKLLAGLTKHLPEMRSATLIGGEPIQKQLTALQRDPRIVVATPDRLVDHLKQGNLSLSAVEIAVLDEADEMLASGFASQLVEIHRHLPKTRQTLLFAALLDSGVDKLASRYLKDPIQVKADSLREKLNRQSAKKRTPARPSLTRSAEAPGWKASRSPLARPRAMPLSPSSAARH